MTKNADSTVFINKQAPKAKSQYFLCTQFGGKTNDEILEFINNTTGVTVKILTRSDKPFAIMEVDSEKIANAVVCKCHGSNFKTGQLQITRLSMQNSSDLLRLKDVEDVYTGGLSKNDLRGHTKTLLLQPLPANIDYNTIRKVYPESVSLQIIQKNRHKSTPRCFVEFATVEECSRVFDERRKIAGVFPNRFFVPQRKRPSAKACPAEQMETMTTTANINMGETHKVEDNECLELDVTRKSDCADIDGITSSFDISVYNVSYKVTAENLRDVFPNVCNVRLPRNSKGKSKGYAVLSFASDSDAYQAVQQGSSIELAGRALDCRLRYQSAFNNDVALNTADIDVKKAGIKEKDKEVEIPDDGVDIQELKEPVKTMKKKMKRHQSDEKDNDETLNLNVTDKYCKVKKRKD